MRKGRLAKFCRLMPILHVGTIDFESGAMSVLRTAAAHRISCLSSRTQVRVGKLTSLRFIPGRGRCAESILDVHVLAILLDSTHHGRSE